MTHTEIVTLLNSGNTPADLATATTALAACTLAQLSAINAHPDLVCHAYGKTKTAKIQDLTGGIQRVIDSMAISRSC